MQALLHLSYGYDIKCLADNKNAHPGSLWWLICQRILSVCPLSGPAVQINTNFMGNRRIPVDGQGYLLSVSLSHTRMLVQSGVGVQGLRGVGVLL